MLWSHLKLLHMFRSLESFQMTSGAALRFTDFATLLQRMLAPLGGHEDLSVVSLKEAVQPLLDIVPRLERNVFVVKRELQTAEGWVDQ